MNIEIKPLRKQDFNAARKFVIEGMHLGWYTGNNTELYLYSKYFWYLKLSRASTVLGAYMGETLVGVLLADINGKPKMFPARRYRAFVRLVTFFLNLGYRDTFSAYETANREMFAAFRAQTKADGELNFFAVNPEIKGKGIGSLLLNELAQQEKGKHIYLYTDSGSTYQFYARRGFAEEGRREILLEIHGKEVPLTCFLFSKKL